MTLILLILTLINSRYSLFTLKNWRLLIFFNKFTFKLCFIDSIWNQWLLIWEVIKFWLLIFIQRWLFFLHGNIMTWLKFFFLFHFLNELSILFYFLLELYNLNILRIQLLVKFLIFLDLLLNHMCYFLFSFQNTLIWSDYV